MKERFSSAPKALSLLRVSHPTYFLISTIWRPHHHPPETGHRVTRVINRGDFTDAHIANHTRTKQLTTSS